MCYNNWVKDGSECFCTLHIYDSGPLKQMFQGRHIEMFKAYLRKQVIPYNIKEKISKTVKVEFDRIVASEKIALWSQYYEPPKEVINVKTHKVDLD